MRKYAFLVLLLVFSLGCIGQRPVKIEANNGLRIQEFSADPIAAEFNDNVLFAVDVENVGGTTAKNVELKLFGIEGIWNVVGGASASADAVKNNYNNEEFDPPVQTQNRPGDFKTVTKAFLPPTLPEGVEQDFPVTARATYDYSTTGSIIVPTISKSLLRIKSNKGEVVDSSPRITNSNGPIKIGLSKGTVPVVVDETRTDQQEATFVIEFLNVGDGFPVTEDKAVRTLGLLQGSITIMGPGMTFKECLGTASGGTRIDFTNDPSTIDLLKLRSNGRLPLSCTVLIDRSIFTPTTSGIITFSVQMNYRYFVEKTINVHVIGSREGGTTGVSGGIPGGTPSALLRLISPAPGSTITTTTPTLQWSAVSGANCYKFNVFKPSGDPMFDNGRASNTNFFSNWESTTQRVFPGTFSWSVVAFKERCDAEDAFSTQLIASATSTFTVSAGATAPTPVPGCDIQALRFEPASAKTGETVNPNIFVSSSTACLNRPGVVMDPNGNVVSRCTVISQADPVCRGSPFRAPAQNTLYTAFIETINPNSVIDSGEPQRAETLTVIPPTPTTTPAPTASPSCSSVVLTLSPNPAARGTAVTPTISASPAASCSGKSAAVFSSGNIVSQCIIGASGSCSGVAFQPDTSLVNSIPYFASVDVNGDGSWSSNEPQSPVVTLTVS